MRARGALILPIVVALLAPPAEAESEGRVSAVVGWKALYSEAWQYVDQQDELGATLSIGRRGWPVLIALDVLRSSRRVSYMPNFIDFPSTVDGSTLEVAAGLRKFFGRGAAHPYLGGGIVWIDGEYEEQSYSGAPQSVGAHGYGGWVNFGAVWRLGRRFNLGLDFRWTYVEAENPYQPSGPDRSLYRGEDLSLGGVHGGVTLGYEW